MLTGRAAPPFASLDPSGGALPEALRARLITPALRVDLAAARRNIRRTIELCGGDPARWRPHVKTTKLPQVWRELVLAGVRHFKCATTREAAVLCELLDAQGVGGDVLLAHPLRGPALVRLGAIAAAHPRQRLAVLCEDAAALDEVPQSLAIFVDVNVGMDRTGIPWTERGEIVALARRAGPRLAGLHAYEGHLHQEDRAQRADAAREVFEACADIVRAIVERGSAVPELVTSGTPSFQFALASSALAELAGTAHRVSPGTVVFHDARSEELAPELALEPAALVWTRVVSLPAQGLATCDAGSKALAAEAGAPLALVLGHPHLVPHSINEEHLVLRSSGGPLPERGTPLLLVPRHVCPTVNLFDEALLFDGGRFVGAAPVRARGHETLLDP